MNGTELRRLQRTRLQHLLTEVARTNPFYRSKLGDLSTNTMGVEDLPKLPFTTKQELVEDQEENPPWGTNLTYPVERYVRLHKTSGTTGRPLAWPDTQESWTWFRGCWRQILELAGVAASDRVFVAFSFGPFIGFWGGFEAAQDLGALTLTGGALSTQERLDTILEQRATVLISTPTYALRLAEVAEGSGIDLVSSPVRLGIHAGEPGASVPNVRARIERAWGMRCVDHAGATEVGAWGVAPGEDNHMSVLETDFIPEIVDPDGDALVEPNADGIQRGELVLTNLGRLGSPVIRYRTGDIVEMVAAADPELPYRRLRGGVLSRADGMIVVRGVNVYPSAIENLIRSVPEVVEFRATVVETRDLPHLKLEIEVAGDEPGAVARTLSEVVHGSITLTPEVVVVEASTLPRFEFKARHFVFESRE
ncbi:MAG: AMP-binding protein [Acidobacteriota bacterium]|nr:AMP-binding protein [Acidobacteriota bacterium]